MSDSPIYVAPFIGLGVPLKAPTADGTANQVIQTDGNGNLSFATVGGGITINSTAITSGAVNRILRENSSNQVTSDSKLTFDGSTLTIVSGVAGGVIGFGGANHGIKRVTGSNSIEVFTYAGGNVILSTSGAGGGGNEFILDMNGQVGINTNPPACQLDITARNATTVALALTLAATPTANAIEVNANGGSGGDIASVDEKGGVFLGDYGSDPTPPSNQAGIYGKNVTTTTELFAVDEAGNASQLTPHASDGPPELYNEEPGIESVTGTFQLYRGEIRWLNHEDWRKGVVVETFDEYNARRGLVSGNPGFMVKRDWDENQDAADAERLTLQEKWDAEREEDAKDFAKKKAEFEELAPEERGEPPVLAKSRPRPKSYERKEKPQWLDAKLKTTRQIGRP